MPVEVEKEVIKEVPIEVEKVVEKEVEKIVQVEVEKVVEVEREVRLRQLVCKQDQAATFSVIVFMTIPSSYLAPW